MFESHNATEGSGLLEGRCVAERWSRVRNTCISVVRKSTLSDNGVGAIFKTIY